MRGKPAKWPLLKSSYLLGSSSLYFLSFFSLYVGAGLTLCIYVSKIRIALTETPTKHTHTRKHRRAELICCNIGFAFVANTQQIFSDAFSDKCLVFLLAVITQLSLYLFSLASLSIVIVD